MPDPSTIIVCPNCATKNRVPATPTGVPRCSVCHTLLPWIVDSSPGSFDEEITASVPVLVDFWAPWCGPCRAVSPLVERAGRDQAGRLKVVKLNVDEAPEIANRYQVSGIPLLVLVCDGQEVDRLVGAVPQERLRAWLDPHLQAVPSAGRTPPVPAPRRRGRRFQDDGGSPSAAEISSSTWFSASLICLPPIPRKPPSLCAPATAWATVITNRL
jgi:thioredoxin 2